MDAIAPAELIDSQHVPLLFLNAKNPAAGNQAFGGFVDSTMMRAIPKKSLNVAGRRYPTHMAGRPQPG
ncbi:hypothetical protein CDS [Bradyrhizobium sp. G22]|nr:hypothetical protein CDS [Bradyrhizobium sp. G22]